MARTWQMTLRAAWLLGSLTLAEALSLTLDFHSTASAGTLSQHLAHEALGSPSADHPFSCFEYAPALKSNVSQDVEQACEKIAAEVLGDLDNKGWAGLCVHLFEPLLNDPLRGPWLANTRAQEAIMAYVTRYKEDRDVMYGSVFLVGGGYGVPQEVTVRTSKLGGFSHLFNVIKNFSNDVDLQMQTWRALSDPSYTPSGSKAIANEGGQYEGIKFMVRQMEAHPAGHQAVGAADRLDLLYEIMQVAGGTLWMNAAELGPVYFQEGFARQIVHAMEVEHDLRGTQDVACKCMSKFVTSVPLAAVDLMDRGVVKLIKNAMDTFHDYDPTPFCMGHTLGNEYPVVPFCVQSLLAMAEVSPGKASKLMQEAGLEQTLASIRPDVLNGSSLLNFHERAPQLQREVRALLMMIRGH